MASPVLLKSRNATSWAAAASSGAADGGPGCGRRALAATARIVTEGEAELVKQVRGVHPSGTWLEPAPPPPPTAPPPPPYPPPPPPPPAPQHVQPWPVPPPVPPEPN